MRNAPVDSSLFVRNRERLSALLPKNAIAIIHANDVMPRNADGTMAFQQNADLYYLSGVNQEETVLMVYPDAENERHREILFVRETNEHIAVWEGEKLDKDSATTVSGVKNVQWTSSFEDLLHALMPQVEQVFLATNEHTRAEVIVETRNARFIKDCRERYPLHDYKRLAPLMHELRVIKDDVEVEQLQKAVDITGDGFRRVLGFVKPGVGEWEVEAEYLHEFVRQGSKGFAYAPIVGSGKNACVLHYVESKCFCGDGELLLMDVAAEWMGWNADMTRTIPVNGTFSPRQRAVYDAVLRVLRGANNLLRPGVKMADYQKKVMQLMEEELVGLGLFTQEEADTQDEGKPLVKKYFMHGTSHHLGLDVHDVSPPNCAVAEGMVFTIEPGIYILEEGLGVRLENDVVIGKDGNRDLFENIPIEADEIEALMAQR